MEVDSSPLRRERSPETAAAEERPAKKPRTEASSGVDGPKTSSKKRSKFSKKTMQKLVHPEEGTPDDVLWHEVKEILGDSVVDDTVARKADLDAPLKFGDVLELDVIAMSSNGDSLCRLPEPSPPWLVITPFALIGERIRVKVVRNGRMVSYADLLDVITPNNSLRDMSRVKCRYFGSCAGCQYQMLDYSTQLDFKRQVVEKAYRYFSGMPSEEVPGPLPTIGSPLQYNYRTKITPHFDAPPKGKAREGWQPWIGFDAKGRRMVLDIEECPIATPVLNEALGPARQAVKEKIDTYKRGSTILMRDSLQVGTSTTSEEEENHVCIQDHKATVRERVGTTLFEFPANSFFQNNNSVLVPLTEYVRTAILSPPGGQPEKQPRHLVDTYCGSGLFAITLSPFFESVVGIEISEESIRSAKHNVSLNGISDDKCDFRAGKAEAIFSVVQDLPPDETVIVIDPPRKGCDDKFIEQLLLFGASTVVYVSCNVHTQARDVGKIVRGSKGGYVLESLRGFDLFPQTAHVESVAVLRKPRMSG